MTSLEIITHHNFKTIEKLKKLVKKSSMNKNSPNLELMTLFTHNPQVVFKIKLRLIFSINLLFSLPPLSLPTRKFHQLLISTISFPKLHVFSILIVFPCFAVIVTTVFIYFCHYPREIFFSLFFLVGLLFFILRDCETVVVRLFNSF